LIFAAFALKDVDGSHHAEKNRAHCLYVILFAKPVGIYVISSATTFLKFKIGSTNIGGYISQADLCVISGNLAEEK